MTEPTPPGRGSASDLGQYSAVDQCSLCRRRELTRPVCAAFPDGIPIEIIIGVVDHLEPVEGDHGLQRLPTPPSTTDGPVLYYLVTAVGTGVEGAVWMSQDEQAIGYLA